MKMWFIDRLLSTIIARLDALVASSRRIEVAINKTNDDRLSQADKAALDDILNKSKDLATAANKIPEPTQE